MTINCGDNRPFGRLVLGVIVMVLGLALALDNFGLFQARYIFRLWPVVLIVIGLTRLQQSVRHGGRPEGYVLTLVGVGLILMNFGLLGFRQALAFLFLTVGGVIVFRAWRGTSGSSPDSFSLESSQRLDAFALLGGVHRVSRATEFRGGSASAALGGCDIDLREADMPEGGSAVLDTLAIMGGIEVRVPEDWSVETRGMAVLGGFEDKTRRPLDDRKRLVITGLAVMGGVEVKN
jgi:predicted membrane protein